MMVAAIVDQHIQPGHLRLDLLPEAAVALIANEDLGPFVFIGLAGTLYVNAVDVTLGAEILPPHPEASAAIDADFQQVQFSASELLQVTMVNIEVMIPFPNAWAFGVRIEVLAQRVRLHLRRCRGNRSQRALPSAPCAAVRPAACQEWQLTQ